MILPENGIQGVIKALKHSDGVRREEVFDRLARLLDLFLTPD